MASEFGVRGEGFLVWLLKVWQFGVLGFGLFLGFRVLGFGLWGFRALGFNGSWVEGFGFNVGQAQRGLKTLTCDSYIDMNVLCLGQSNPLVVHIFVSKMCPRPVYYRSSRGCSEAFSGTQERNV